MKSRIVFITRDPVVNQVGGSTTFALSLLTLLVQQGATVTIVATSASSRSPRAWFRVKAPLPAGVELFAPGYLRVGQTYLNLLSGKAWARLVSRAAVRLRVLVPLRRLLERAYGDALFTTAWDLTTPTLDEHDVALRAVKRRDATTVMVNYACWGPLLSDAAMARRKRVILMHDVLSARVQSFKDAGRPLDCPDIDEHTEMSWLQRADCVLAAQLREAEYVQQRISSLVLVTPIAMHIQPSSPAPEPLRCLFVGSKIPPNQDGLGWFLEAVWPWVREALPDAKLAIAGTICDAVPDDLPGVEKLGRVESLNAEYERASACIVPLRVGSGIKIKLLEALSFGKAIVSTSVGIQGLEEWAHEAVAVADEPPQFAQALVTLLRETDVRKAQEAAGLALTREHYSGAKALDPAFVEAVL